MRKISLLVIPALLLVSCLKENLPLVENIKKGDKWGIEIGNSAKEVYNRLQSLGIEKDFSQVAVVGRKSYSEPEELESSLEFYNATTLQSNSGRIERVIIQFPADTIASISTGGALPEEVDRWPLNVADSSAFNIGDKVTELYPKLESLYRISDYSDLDIILPDKPLNKSFDPDMENFNEWAFSFFTDAGPGKRGRSDVRLYFEDGFLERIYHKYDEFEVQH